MISSTEILQILKNNKILFKEKYHCTEIGLFGSFARNEQSENSDIDILVEFEEGTPNLFEVENNLKQYLKNIFDREVDICTKKWIKPIFKNLVLNETLYA